MRRVGCTVVAHTQPQEDPRPTALAIAKASQRKYTRYGGSHRRTTGRKSGGACSNMCSGSGGPRTAHKAGNSVPVWLATRSRLVTRYTGIAATGTRPLDLHRCFSHQASHTPQPLRGGAAAAASACVAHYVPV